MKERILITVKTYPTLSKSHGELVCTAGIRSDGSWVRLYPVPFRKLKDYERYHKYQWLTANLIKRSDDPRPESHTPEHGSINLGDVIPAANQWAERCRLVLDKGAVFDDMTKLISRANSNELSLATYKPREIIGLVIEPCDRDWPKNKICAAENAHRQGDLFADDEQFVKDLKLVDKLPYVFSYRFLDKDGTKRTLMIEDWEIGQLYWNCLKNAEGDEAIAIQKVKEKYVDQLAEKRDLHLFVGTTKQYHGWANNPFVIVGTFTPPQNRQPEFSLWE